MSLGKKYVLSADGNTATLTDATVLDAVTTIVSTDSGVTGTLGLLQRVGLVVGGMAIQSKRLRDSYNPL